jgi:hypothetical protein
MKLICVIGDIVRSRGIPDRPRFQARLQKTLNAVNRRRRKALVSPCTITLGDEFQAVYRSGDTLFDDFWLIRHDLYPVRIRFSLGIGELSTPVNRQRAIGMDGPAFHAARAALTELKESEAMFRVAVPNAIVPPWINLALDLVSLASGDWKKSRLAIFGRLLEDQEVKVIASAVGLTNAAVYKSIKSGGLRTMKSLLGEINAWIGSELNDK